MVGYPSETDYKKMIRHGLITNCDVTEQDVENAHELFGKDIYALVCASPIRLVSKMVTLEASNAPRV